MDQLSAKKIGLDFWVAMEYLIKMETYFHIQYLKKEVGIGKVISKLDSSLME